MKNKPRNDREEDTKEMIEWRSTSQEEMDECWKKLAEKMEDKVRTTTRWRTKKEVLTGENAPFWNGGVNEEAGSTEYVSGEKIVVQEFSLCLFKEYNLQRVKSMHEDSTEGEEMKRQQRMKIRSKERMDADNRWWVAELLAADCEKAWLNAGWEDTMQKNVMIGWRR